MERAQPDIFATAPRELDATPDDLRQRHALAQLVEEARRESHALLAFDCQLSAVSMTANPIVTCRTLPSKNGCGL